MDLARGIYSCSGVLGTVVDGGDVTYAPPKARYEHKGRRLVRGLDAVNAHTAAHHNVDTRCCINVQIGQRIIFAIKDIAHDAASSAVAVYRLRLYSG